MSSNVCGRVGEAVAKLLEPGLFSESRVRAGQRPARRSTSDEPAKQTITHAAARLVDMQFLHTCSRGVTDPAAHDS